MVAPDAPGAPETYPARPNGTLALAVRLFRDKVTLFFNKVTLFRDKVTLFFNKVTLFFNKVTLFRDKVSLLGMCGRGRPRSRGMVIF